VGNSLSKGYFCGKDICPQVFIQVEGITNVDDGIIGVDVLAIGQRIWCLSINV